ncbi:MAG: peptidyl-prolyl cis-trans isomerase, partial [Eubacterium sp.]|nr:peptidyl-prolyl cis-trans isomerase [Eubacterium sp.]
LPNSKEKMNPRNDALTVGDMKVSVGMYNLYYNLVVNNYKQYAEQGAYKIDFTKDLSEQKTVDENDKEVSWEEVFKLDTIKQLQYVAAYYEPAIEAGITLTDAQKEDIKSSVDSLKTSASEAGVSLKEYLKENYGEYCGVETIEKFYEQRNICETYYNTMQIKLSVSEEEALKYYEENKDNYITFAYIENQFSLDGSEKGISSIADVQKKVQGYCDQIKSIKDMKELIPEACAGLISMAIEQNYFSDEKAAVQTLRDSVVVTYNAETVAGNFGEDILKWFKSADRKEGDTTYYINEDYGYACIFLYTAEAKPDETELYSVRHILISPKDDPTAVSSATDADWSAALLKAEQVYNEYDKSGKTEVDFAELAEKYSADVSSTSAGNAGLYGGSISKAGLGEMVPEFEKWATDKSRKYGDVEIVKSDFGYHIMYYIYDGPTYIFNMMDDALKEKQNDLINSVEYKERLAFRKTTVVEPVTASASEENTE